MKSVDSMPAAAVALASIFEWMDPALKVDQGWKLDGACLLEPKDLFFPDRGESAQPAKLICSTCKVKTECLRYAIESREWCGIWGGTNEKDRRPLIRAHLFAELLTLLGARFAPRQPAATLAELVDMIVAPLPKHGCGCDECRELGQRRRERSA